MTTKPTRGILNHNPSNIRRGDPWQGLSAQQTDTEFCQFKDPTWGVRACARLLISYQDKYGIRSITDIISRWAPPNENDTSAYIRAVERSSGLPSFLQLNLHQYEHLRPIVEAIIRHECGRGPKSTKNTWYDDAIIDSGLQKAGVVKMSPKVAKVPVTKETVAATGTAGLGVGQLADVAPQVITALDGQQDHLSSGSWFRIALGVMTIGLAVYIAYSQVKKHQQGLVA